MVSLEIPPSARLRPYVQLIWYFESDPGAGLDPPVRIAPDGVVELVFHYRDPTRVRLAGEEPATQPRSSAVTLTRRFAEICPSASAGFLSVRFRPWGAHAFLRFPVSELADRVVAADELWPGCRELEERLAAATTVGSRVALVQGFLLARLRNDRRIDAEPLVRAVWRRGGDVRVAELCAELGLTERTLERTFAAAVGVPPKSFIRLSRFLHACSRLRSGGCTSLTRLAHDCGYYDQAHFVADVRAFSGMTPRELVAAESFAFLEPG
jgi:AraC-like DNA-binding protein